MSCFIPHFIYLNKYITLAFIQLSRGIWDKFNFPLIFPQKITPRSTRLLNSVEEKHSAMTEKPKSIGVYILLLYVYLAPPKASTVCTIAHFLLLCALCEKWKFCFSVNVLFVSFCALVVLLSWFSTAQVNAPCSWFAGWYVIVLCIVFSIGCRTNLLFC